MYKAFTIGALVLSFHTVPAVRAQIGPGNNGNISTAVICTRDSDNYILRTRPNQNARSRVRIARGRSVLLTGDTRNIAGITWRKVNFNGFIGWVRGDYLCS
jgi:hypothetical protein